MSTTDSTKTNLQLAVPFFAVADIAASVRFYTTGLGFEMTKQWTPGGKLEWCWLEREGVAFMLQEYHGEGHGAWTPEGKLGMGVTICIICADALAIYHEITGRGVQASRPMVSNGMWNLSVTDPDGYRLEFESVTEVAEGTPYEEGM